MTEKRNRIRATLRKTVRAFKGIPNGLKNWHQSRKPNQPPKKYIPAPAVLSEILLKSFKVANEISMCITDGCDVYPFITVVDFQEHFVSMRLYVKFKPR